MSELEHAKKQDKEHTPKPPEPAGEKPTRGDVARVRALIREAEARASEGGSAVTHAESRAIVDAARTEGMSMEELRELIMATSVRDAVRTALLAAMV